jgi:hypothetical protein
MHSRNLGTPCDPEHSRDPEDRHARTDEQRREKMLDKTLADSFPTSDPPSSIPDPGEADSLGPNQLEETAKDLLFGLPPGSWAALTIDNRELIATGTTRDEAEQKARERGYRNVSLIEVMDPEAPLQNDAA